MTSESKDDGVQLYRLYPCESNFGSLATKDYLWAGSPRGDASLNFRLACLRGSTAHPKAPEQIHLNEDSVRALVLQMLQWLNTKCDADTQKDETCQPPNERMKSPSPGTVSPSELNASSCGSTVVTVSQTGPCSDPVVLSVS